jgi:hypothetical protein
MPIDKAAVVRQIDAVLDRLRELQKSHTGDDGFRYYLCISHQEALELSTLMRHTVERFRPPGVVAYGDSVLDRLPKAFDRSSDHLWGLAGILSALRDDYDANRLQSFHELVHANLFADFLEQATHLHDQGYKDAAAVTAGAVLEEHLRKLCARHAVPTMVTDAKGNVRPKTMDAMNNDLTRQPPGVYDNIERQSVQAWAAVRNAAAHGEYGKYNDEQVRQMIEGVRGFITRHPA